MRSRLSFLDWPLGQWEDTDFQSQNEDEGKHDRGEPRRQQCNSGMDCDGQSGRQNAFGKAVNELKFPLEAWSKNERKHVAAFP
jgi:hypothetical protein